MTRNQKLYILYCLATTLILVAVIFFVSSKETINVASTDIQIVGEKIAYFIAFGLLTVLIFRTIVAALRFRVSKLARWKTLSEKVEDEQFVKMIEMLVSLLSVVTTIAIELGILFYRNAMKVMYLNVKDVIIYALSAVIFGYLAFIIPALSEKEYTSLQQYKTGGTQKKKQRRQ